MEVTLEKRYPVAASGTAAWLVLRDVPIVGSCMPGAEITEQVDETHYKGKVAVKVGPAKAAFAGDIEVLELDEPARRVRLMGKGADKGGSNATMDLIAHIEEVEGGGCELVGTAEIIVNGKFAQFGGRMMGSVADVLLAQFAQNFATHAVAASDDGATPATATSDAAPGVAAAPPRELNALALMWSVIKQWFSNRFGKGAQAR